MKIEKFSLPFLGFLQATGLLVYIFLVAEIMLNAGRVFGSNSNILVPIAFLLLFVISAMICGILTLGRAGFLFLEKRYKESFTLLFWTIGWSLLYLTILFLILFLTSPKIILIQR